MYENTYMYAIERSDDYLAHYGVRGMKWGVRKAIASGNSARLSRQYAKASKKLAKLEKRATKAGKYRKRAIGYGIGAAAAGGLAAAGTTGVGRMLHKTQHIVTPGAKALGGAMTATGKAVGNLANAIPGKQLGLAKLGGQIGAAGTRMSNDAYKAGMAARRAGNSVINWGAQDTMSRALRRPLINGSVATNGAVSSGLNKAQGALRGVSNNTIARIGAGAIGAGLAAASAKNAYRAATAQKKAARFKSEMNKAFAGTQYANGGGNRQGGKKRKRK